MDSTELRCAECGGGSNFLGVSRWIQRSMFRHPRLMAAEWLFSNTLLLPFIFPWLGEVSQHKPKDHVFWSSLDARRPPLESLI